MPASLERGEIPQEVARALVPSGVVLEIKLVVVLGVPPGAGGDDLGDDLPGSAVPLGIGLSSNLARDPLLLGIVEVYGAAVPRADVGSLPIRRRRVVHPVEELQDLPVRQGLGVVEYL